MSTKTKKPAKKPAKRPAKRPENQAPSPHLAERLYTAYCAAVGGKAFNGDVLPTWAEFAADPEKTVQRDAWIAAAALVDTPEPDPAMASLAGRVFLTQALTDAERERVHGPKGLGWPGNETLRPALEERIAFLAALLELLPD